MKYETNLDLMSIKEDIVEIKSALNDLRVANHVLERKIDIIKCKPDVEDNRAAVREGVIVKLLNLIDILEFNQGKVEEEEEDQ